MNELQPIEPETATLPLPADAATIAKLHRRARRQRHLPKISGAFLVVSLISITIANFAHLYFTRRPTPQWLDFLNYLLIVACVLPVLLAKRWTKTIHALTQAVGVQAIGPFVEGLEVMEGDAVTTELLASLLSRLQSSDAHLLTPQHHRILNRLLSRDFKFVPAPTTALILATLKAYEQVGATADLPTVQLLANGAGCHRLDPKVQAAAQACLPYLQARSEVQHLRENLLRASSETADNPVTLLRPAHSVSVSDPAQMLRASPSETPE